MYTIRKDTKSSNLKLKDNEKVILEKRGDLYNSPHSFTNAQDQGRIILTNKRLIYICTMMLAKSPNTRFQINIEDIESVKKSNVRMFIPMGVNIVIKPNSVILNGDHEELIRFNQETYAKYKFAFLGSRKEVISAIESLIN